MTIPNASGESPDGTVSWTVAEQWSCTCDYKPTSAAPQCMHIVDRARRLSPHEANSLINARRRAGHVPLNLAAKLARESSTPA